MIYTCVLVERKQSGVWVKGYEFYAGHLWNLFINDLHKKDYRFQEIPEFKKESVYVGAIRDLKFPIKYPIECINHFKIEAIANIKNKKQEIKNDSYTIVKKEIKEFKPVVSIKPKTKTETRKEKIFSRFDFKCVICGSTKELTQDHIIPISKGGTDRLDNLQCMCKRCNQVKGNIRMNNETLKEIIKLL